MKTIDIKGKDYVVVNERVKYFRSSFSDYSLVTEMLSNEGGVCIFKASVLDKERNIVSTGHAYEKEGSSFINKTSYIENCETSAVGRALGILGIGIDTSIASAEEVANAIKSQSVKYITIKQIKEIVEKADIVGTTVEKILSVFQIESLDKLPVDKFNTVMTALNNKEKK